MEHIALCPDHLEEVCSPFRAGGVLTTDEMIAIFDRRTAVYTLGGSESYFVVLERVGSKSS
jgi:hypothetical protein